MHPLYVEERQFLQSQRIILAHRLKVAWAHDENFYFALSQIRWGQSCCPTPPRGGPRRHRGMRSEQILLSLALARREGSFTLGPDEARSHH
jgi:hypothetical protein